MKKGWKPGLEIYSITCLCWGSASLLTSSLLLVVVYVMLG